MSWAIWNLNNERFETDQLRHFNSEESERSDSMELRHFDLSELDREGRRRFDLAGTLHFDYVVLDREDLRRFDSSEPLDLVAEVHCPYFEIFLFCLDF